MNGDIEFDKIKRLNLNGKLSSSVLVHFRGKDDKNVREKYLKYKRKYINLKEKYDNFM